MTDIAEQLYWRFCFCSRSAAEVKSLEEEVERLREALIAAEPHIVGLGSARALLMARAALENKR